MHIVTDVVAMVSWHRWRRWRPCDAWALCPLKPWWAALGSRYSSTMHTNLPDTSIYALPPPFIPLIDVYFILLRHQPAAEK